MFLSQRAPTSWSRHGWAAQQRLFVPQIALLLIFIRSTAIRPFQGETRPYHQPVSTLCLLRNVTESCSRLCLAGVPASLSAHTRAVCWPSVMFPAEILEHSHPRSPTVCMPELQCPRLTAVLGRKALGWELLGIPSAYSASCSSDLQDTEDLQSRERSQNKALGSSTVRRKLPDTSLWHMLILHLSCRNSLWLSRG